MELISLNIKTCFVVFICIDLCYCKRTKLQENVRVTSTCKPSTHRQSRATTEERNIVETITEKSIAKSRGTLKDLKPKLKSKTRSRRDSDTQSSEESFSDTESSEESFLDNEESELKTLEVKNKRKRKPKPKLGGAMDLDLTASNSEPPGFESDEIKMQLNEGEEFLDFSDLAKMKTFTLDEGSVGSNQQKPHSISKDNPLLNFTCPPFSIEEEKNISTGYLDQRIANVIEHADDYPEGGDQLIEDMQKLYCYLRHVNQLVVEKVRRGKGLMKSLVEDDPHFIQIRFDTDDLTDHFSWVTEETEAFERIMDLICYQYKCLVARYTEKRKS